MTTRVVTNGIVSRMNEVVPLILHCSVWVFNNVSCPRYSHSFGGGIRISVLKITVKGVLNDRIGNDRIGFFFFEKYSENAKKG